MARASTLARICVLMDGDTVPDYPCFSTDHEHKPNPQWWITEDGIKFKLGDRLFNYYDGHWGRVISEPDEDGLGWFTFEEDGGHQLSLNSVRVSSYNPKER